MENQRSNTERAAIAPPRPILELLNSIMMLSAYLLPTIPLAGDSSTHLIWTMLTHDNVESNQYVESI